jgi:hypothetical protein
MGEEGVMLGRVVAMGLLASLAIACVVENGPSQPDSDPSNPLGSAPSSSATVPNAGDGPTQPMLVKVDPNVTMTATPGDGVGVFTEYKTGGHWHIWWTCDTTRTGQACAFDVQVTPSSGTLANVGSEQFATTDSLATTASSLHAQTTTSTTAEGVTFDATAGIPITLTASVGGLKDGSFLFFVQDGQVNGGYTGQLTDPLRFEGSSP